MITTRHYISEAIAAILEDIFDHPVPIPSREDLESFFDSEEFETFREMVRQEFDLVDDTIVETAVSFQELIALLEDELIV
jgi:hypothetical protein